MSQTPADDPRYPGDTAIQAIFDRVDDAQQSSMALPETVIDLREASHGDYRKQAQFAQLIKGLFHGHENWRNIPAPQKESIDMIIVKLSRVMAGDPAEPDHWLDISGYAKMIFNLITKGSHLG